MFPARLMRTLFLPERYPRPSSACRIIGGFNRSSQHVQFDWPASTGPELRREFSIRGSWGPCIERVSNNCEYVRTVCAQIGSFREVLSKQSISVLVRSALPRAVRFAEVDGKAGCNPQADPAHSAAAPHSLPAWLASAFWRIDQHATAPSLLGSPGHRFESPRCAAPRGRSSTVLAPAGKQYDVCLFPERAEEQSPHVPRKTVNVLTAAWSIAINVMVACRPTS